MSPRGAPERGIRAARYRGLPLWGWRKTAQRVVSRALSWSQESTGDTAKRILIVNGHPDARPERFCAALCDAYAAGVRSRGIDVRQLAIGALPAFPVSGSQMRSEAIPSDLAAALRSARWANRYVLIFPLWLNAPPAALRRFIELLAEPEIADGGGICPGRRREKRVRVFATMDMPAFALRARVHGGVGCAHDLQIFAGMKTDGMTLIGGVNSVSARQRGDWLGALKEAGASE